MSVYEYQEFELLLYLVSAKAIFKLITDIVKPTKLLILCFVFFRKVKTKKSSFKSKIQRFYINCKSFLLILAFLALIFALIKNFSIISNFHLRNARFTLVIIVFRYVLSKASQ